MAGCRILEVELPGGDESKVDEDLLFEITLDVAEPLKDDAVFRCVYVTEAAIPGEGEHELEAIDVGNGPGLPQGVMKFRLEVPAPSRRIIEQGGGMLEVDGLYISAIYRGSEFCRVGYYVRHEYVNPELRENPPQNVDWAGLQRVLSEPRTTYFSIRWDAPAAAAATTAVDASGDALLAPAAGLSDAAAAAADVAEAFPADLLDRQPLPGAGGPPAAALGGGLGIAAADAARERSRSPVGRPPPLATPPL